MTSDAGSMTSAGSALILNLGCGTKTSAHSSVVNIDWSILLRIRANPVLRRLAPALLNKERLDRLRKLPANLIVHNLAKGIPFEDGTVDAIYHSHVLEHLDRHFADDFIREAWRVLKPNGIVRIVVPDFERYCEAYLNHVAMCRRDGPDAWRDHDKYLEPILLQSVIREASGTSRQKPLRRFLENLMLGDARKRGQTHQWMYDRFNLAALLVRNGFSDPNVKQFDTSDIPGWSDIGLDCDESGREYKPESLYMEARKAHEVAAIPIQTHPRSGEARTSVGRRSTQ